MKEDRLKGRGESMEVLIGGDKQAMEACIVSESGVISRRVGREG